DLTRELTKHGAKDVYLLFHIERSNPIYVIPLEKGADAKNIGATLKNLDPDNKSIGAEVLHEAVVFGELQTIRQLKTLTPEARPELARAFVAVGDGVAHGVLFAGPDLRKMLEKEAPTLPPQLGGGSIKVLTDGLQWAGFQVDAPPRFRITAIAQAADKDAAKAILTLAERAKKDIVSQEPIRANVPNAEKVFGAFVPKVNGDRLLLSVDEPMLASLVEPGMILVRRAALRLTAVNNVKHLGLAIINQLSEEPGNSRLPA